MKTILKIIPFVVLIVSCSKPITEEQLKHLNGYWEISEVKTADGDDKEYQTNNNADFFEVTGKKGARSKVVSQMDGKIISNGIKEQFVIVDSVNATYLKYVSDYSKWEEKVVELNEDKLVIINDNDIKYTYKKFTPIVINE